MTAPVRPSRPTVPAALAAGLALLLAACGGGAGTTDPTTAPPPPAAAPAPDGQDEIATLETGDAEPPSGADDAVDTDPLVARYGEPVRLRLDMSEAEEDAAYAIYDACIEGESGVSPEARAGTGDVGPVEPVVSPEDAAAIDRAHEDCLVVAPLPPWEYDVQNPDAVTFVQAIVDCLRTKGVLHVEVVQDAGTVGVSFGGPDNHAPSISLGLEHYDACEQEVAASGVGR